METVLAANDYNPLIFCIIYQTFYLIFIFEGTAFFNPEALIPYVASCAMVEYYQWKYKKMKGLGMNDNVCG
jgi:hypothetical protein